MFEKYYFMFPNGLRNYNCNFVFAISANVTTNHRFPFYRGVHIS